MRLYSRREIVAHLGKLGQGELCADPIDLALGELYNLLPVEAVSTLECAEKHRYFRAASGSGKFLWTRERTPYLVGFMHLGLDEPTCREAILVKPGRSGGTAAFECHEFKLMRHGPMPDMLIYLGSDSEVDSYCDKGFKYLFEDHPEIQAKVGTGRSDDKLKSKKVAGRSVDVLQANNKTVTGRQAGWIRVDEFDTFPKRLRATMLQQIRVRMRQMGNWGKAGITSHPDAGWASGVAEAWLQSSMGIFIWQCPNCAGYGSPYPTSHWPDVPRFMLDYKRLDDGAPALDRVELAERTAGMRCPHCDSMLDDKQRWAMVDDASNGPWYGWMQKGQTLDLTAGIIGEPDENPARGFWIHGLMIKQVTNAELARDLEGAIAHRAATGKTDKLKEVLAKVFGEIFDGKSAGKDVSAASLRKKAKEENLLAVGQFPPEAKFITCAIDVGGGKFDVSYRAWDLEGRSWWLDRHTLTQRRWSDGVLRTIATRERIDDWDVLYEVIGRLFPIIGREGWFMPVAAAAIDVGDGNVTWKGREFVRRSIAAGCFWGSPAQPWSKFRLIQGSANARAPEVPVAPTKISKDEHGQAVTPVVLEYQLGVHKLKETAIERLGIDDGGPGQCLFAPGIEKRYFEEYFNERLIDEKWERSGPNESLDLFAYEDAVRLMLRPDRKDIRWDKSPPPWATPILVNVGGGDQRPGAQGEKAQKKPSIYERMNARNTNNRRPRPDG